MTRRSKGSYRKRNAIRRDDDEPPRPEGLTRLRTRPARTTNALEAAYGPPRSFP